MSYKSPFSTSSSKPGHGSIVVALLPPNTPVLREVSYQYPLKLVAPDPLALPSDEKTENATDPSPSLIHTVFLLTYGGGIVAGDVINLSVSLESKTRLILLTQGSTKIFKTPDPNLVSRQCMNVSLAAHSALVYLPDPVQPFAHTAFSQSQIYKLNEGEGNLCVCDWVTSGRSARGENWDIHEYKSRNEVWTVTSDEKGAAKKRLLLRDNLLLDKNGHTNMQLSDRMDGFSVFGTLIIRGAVFSSLAQFFMDEFEALPRIGGRDWGDSAQQKLSPQEERRAKRQQQEKKDGLVWSAANVRGFVLVKFASKEVEGSRNFLKDMIKEEGSVLRNFGERAVLCLK
ncbi:UreD-domain-containing protein [Aaosphaeria arxii CBS 175.79]|uniref:UreD-domain-containing protein n=1 Tax=Aaosphaeria arxii CBS 175.79 TaxID=1450172 RepID=A0A6A5XEA4_9PLEO|nr:UreD-domain-containing protein [Aaosphaeria arxii CBS 175.79]KAF2011382.1 UreD-domain-containing protein [Aaosphaeria arxii CBS 175.79]